MKNITHRNVVLTIVLILAALLASIPSASAQIDASEVFESGYVMLGSDLFVQFGAATRFDCKKIYVSSCTLQEMDSNDNVVSTTNLTPPSTAVKGNTFTAFADYGSKGTSGKRYRIQAVFNADGATITRTSVTVSFK